jgi:ubiquinone/menaquinone biosynthesis C-methylase UbiE
MQIGDAIAMLAGSGLETLGPMTWADLGCGDGTFTVALADLLSPRSVIHAIDRNRAALKGIPSRHHDVRIHTHVGDFIEPWPFGSVDGILMANSLHYVANQEDFVRACELRMTSPRRFLIVEYDTNKGNAWVPYPVSRSRLAELFGGYSCRSLGSRPSQYQRARLYAELMESAPPVSDRSENHEQRAAAARKDQTATRRRRLAIATVVAIASSTTVVAAELNSPRVR